MLKVLKATIFLGYGMFSILSKGSLMLVLRVYCKAEHCNASGSTKKDKYDSILMPVAIR